MLPVKVGAHIFVTVLIFGTLWRIVAFHLMASDNAHFQHIGGAMTTQY